ncbi:MAG: hypothetical protein JXK16_01365 [Thiotrichales bacterium]|nr:hypothetical protein [Thiotrichales bacterium]
MTTVTIKALLIGLSLMILSGCGVLNKGSQYQIPDYYEAGLIVKQPIVGKSYYINDLRCSERSGGCHQEEVVQHRRYEKPYYLSK